MRLNHIQPLLLLIILWTSCGNSETQTSESTAENMPKPDTTITVDPVVNTDTIPEIELFKSVAATFNNNIAIPDSFEYTVLFREKYDEVVRADSMKFPAKGNHDMLAYIPIEGSSEHGYLYCSHETKYKDANLGDGGGGTIFEVKKDSAGWKVISDFSHIDFSNVGGTLRNCGGTVTPHGTILSAEEAYPLNNSHISLAGKGFQDLSDYNGRPKYQNIGYMVEVDPVSKKAMHKLYSMGRFMHEDAHCMSDGKTVYLSDDAEPGVFFKFVADTVGNYTAGQLYAYQMQTDSTAGNWITLPRDTASLIHIRDIAIEKGATMFVRHEWMEEHDGKLYINETADDEFDWKKYVDRGGRPANYLADSSHHLGDHKYIDTYGRVLEFDMVTNEMKVLIEGGISETDSLTVFSNPDAISKVTLGNKTYLVLNEDINWYDKGRSGPNGHAEKMFYNEAYFLDLSIKNPKVTDLVRFIAGPKGCETSGGVFTPDGLTYFVNIMHPWYSNPQPFNRSCTIAITGFDKLKKK